MAINEDKLNAFMGRFVGDLGAVLHAATIVVGDQLGLYKKLAERAEDVDTLATQDRDRPALPARMAVGAGGQRLCRLRPRHAALQPERGAGLRAGAGRQPGLHPRRVPDRGGAVQGHPEDERGHADRPGPGLARARHPALFHGTERFFRPGYAANLVSSWIPALDGVDAKLKAGAKVADIGCGHGASTIIMAQAYPKSRFIGFDYHEPSIEQAREAAAEAGVADRVSFEVARAQDFPGEGYDLVAIFDCAARHGRPGGRAGACAQGVEARRHLADRRALRQRQARGQPEPGRPHLLLGLDLHLHAGLALAGGRRLCLGAQAGEARLRDVVGKGGFKRFRRATQTPFNLVLEARP